MIASDLGDGVARIERIVDLSYEERFRPGRERVEVQRFRTGKFRRSLNDALASRGNALLAERGANTSLGNS